MKAYQGPQGYPSSYQPAPETSTLAVVSLVAGILSFMVLPVIGGLAAVITGHMARNEIRDSQGRLTGDGLATAGLVLGYANLALGLCGLCGIGLWFVGLLGMSSSTSSWGLVPGLLALIG